MILFEVLKLLFYFCSQYGQCLHQHGLIKCRERSTRTIVLSTKIDASRNRIFLKACGAAATPAERRRRTASAERPFDKKERQHLSKQPGADHKDKP